MSSEEVDKLDAGSWFSEEFAGEVVPRLEPFVEWAKGKIKIYFDVKDADIDYLVDLVEKYDFQDDCFFWFGNRGSARAFRKAAPGFELKINAAVPRAVEWAHEEFNATIIECPVMALTPEFIRACRDRNMRIMVREVDPDEEAYRKTIEAGADLINLDHPQLFMDVQSRVLSEADE
jgi:glycerophosphoryl diester phosphodiesterase